MLGLLYYVDNSSIYGRNLLVYEIFLLVMERVGYFR